MFSFSVIYILISLFKYSVQQQPIETNELYCLFNDNSFWLMHFKNKTIVNFHDSQVNNLQKNMNISKYKNFSVFTIPKRLNVINNEYLNVSYGPSAHNGFHVCDYTLTYNNQSTRIHTKI